MAFVEGPESRTLSLKGHLPGGIGLQPGRMSRSNRLPEFVLSRAVKIPGAREQEVDGDTDQRVLRDPLALSPPLPVEPSTEPGQLVELVRAQA